MKNLDAEVASHAGGQHRSLSAISRCGKEIVAVFWPNQDPSPGWIALSRFVPARKGNGEVCYVLVSSNGMISCLCRRHSHRLAPKTERAHTYGALAKA
jgi:hypothetical protein